MKSEREKTSLQLYMKATTKAFFAMPFQQTLSLIDKVVVFGKQVYISRSRVFQLLSVTAFELITYRLFLPSFYS